MSGSRRFVALGELSPEAIARFDSHVDRSGGHDACWPWSGSNSKGYGHLSIATARGLVTLTATRVFWTLANGRPAPDGMFVCHRCDNPPCCNPAHLFLGTHGDNVADMVSKGRASRLTKLRNSHCRNGHALDGDNLIRGKGRVRGCKACRNARAKSLKLERGEYKRKHVFLTLHGRTMILEHWAKELGVSPTTIASRIKSGWSVERTLTMPVRRPTGEGHNVYVPMEKSTILDTKCALLRAPDDETGWQWAPAEGGES